MSITAADLPLFVTVFSTVFPNVSLLSASFLCTEKQELFQLTFPVPEVIDQNGIAALRTHYQRLFATFFKVYSVRATTFGRGGSVVSVDVLPLNAGWREHL